MHLTSVTLHPDRYPTRDCYPFCLPALQQPRRIAFTTPVTLFVGENGTGKSTLLEALSHACGIHIWGESDGSRVARNPHEGRFHRYVSVEWADGPVPGSYFGSGIFNQFARMMDEWAAADPGLLKYFGGQSLMTRSHGQSLMAFFESRYHRKGLYLLDEPETALSPRTQLALLKLLAEATAAHDAQFVIATHSPLLMALPGATLYGFDGGHVRSLRYEETDHFQVYRNFFGGIGHEYPEMLDECVEKP